MNFRNLQRLSTLAIESLLFLIAFGVSLSQAAGWDSSEIRPTFPKAYNYPCIMQTNISLPETDGANDSSTLSFLLGIVVEDDDDDDDDDDGNCQCQLTANDTTYKRDKYVWLDADPTSYKKGEALQEEIPSTQPLSILQFYTITWTNDTSTNSNAPSDLIASTFGDAAYGDLEKSSTKISWQPLPIPTRNPSTGAKLTPEKFMRGAHRISPQLCVEALNPQPIDTEADLYITDIGYVLHKEAHAWANCVTQEQRVLDHITVISEKKSKWVHTLHQLSE